MQGFTFRWLTPVLALLIYAYSLGSGKSGEPNLYTLTLHSDNLRTVHIEADLDAGQGCLRMDWEAAGFLEHGWATFVRNLRVEDQSGNAIPISTETPGCWTFASPPSRRVKISYDVLLNHDRINWEEGGHDESAYVLEDLAFFVGRAVFISPSLDQESAGTTLFKVRFEIPANYSVTASWQGGLEKNLFLVTGIRNLTELGLLVGIQESLTLSKGGIEIKIASGKDFKDVLPILGQSFEMLLPKSVELLGEVPAARFIVIANRAPITTEFEPYFSGGVINNTISIIAPAIPDEEMMPLITYINTHEFLHLWSTHAYPVAEEKKEYWFIEGFTDYLAVRLLHQIGAISEETLLNSPFGFVGNYQKYLAVAGEKSPREAGFDKFGNYDLIYSGGFTMALALDANLRAMSAGARGVVDYMRALSGKYQRTQGKALTYQDLKDVASAIAGTDLNDFFDEYIEGTSVLPLPTILARVGLEMTMENGVPIGSVVKENMSSETSKVLESFLAFRPEDE